MGQEIHPWLKKMVVNFNSDESSLGFEFPEKKTATKKHN